MSTDKARARRIYEALAQQYPDACCSLTYSSPHELLIATILSAQSTDVGVNKATPSLFAAFPSPADYAAVTPEEIQPLIATIGLFRNKAKAIHASMTRIVDEYGGSVPDTMEDLLTLRGVARKTANVVLGNAFDRNEGVVVDTHVTRLSQRLGLSSHAKPEPIEHDLMELFAQECWTMLSHLLVRHGREVCKARGATCSSNRVCKRWCSNA